MTDKPVTDRNPPVSRLEAPVDLGALQGDSLFSERGSPNKATELIYCKRHGVHNKYFSYGHETPSWTNFVSSVMEKPARSSVAVEFESLPTLRRKEGDNDLASTVTFDPIVQRSLLRKCDWFILPPLTFM